MSRIPDAFIDELLIRTDIVALVDRRLPLKKTGREYQALCPFHDEKTPSFTVSPQKQFYHCFGCHAHGTAIGFLMQFDGLDFPAAIEELAASVGLKVPQEFSREHDQHAPLYEILKRAAAFYRKQLAAAPAAIDYLKQRGLTVELVKDYGLGFAPDSWDSLLQALGKNGETRALMARAGLIKQGKQGHYDSLRGRIVFPIRDTRGRVVGFGGRVLDGGEPKYLNSPETPVFHKGRTLYGIFEAHRSGRPERLLVVEGYMDVLALSQSGIEGAVATLGTATTEAHTERLFRTVQDVVFCFDGDSAGERAAWRALEASLPALRDGRQARFMFLPEGEDPDSLVQSEGRERFEARLAKAQPLAEYLFERLSGEVDLDTLDGRARLINLAEPLLARLPQGAFRELALERLARLARTERQTLHEPGAKRAAAQPTAAQKIKRTPVRMAIALLIQRPALAERVVAGQLNEAQLPGVELLLALVEHAQARPRIHTAALLEAFRNNPAHKHLEELAAWRLPVPDEGLEREFDEKLALIQQHALYNRIQALESKQRSEGLSSEEDDELRQLMRSKAGPAADLEK